MVVVAVVQPNIFRLFAVVGPSVDAYLLCSGVATRVGVDIHRERSDALLIFPDDTFLFFI